MAVRLILHATTQINSQFGAIPSNSIPGKRMGNSSKHKITEPTVTTQFTACRLGL